MCVFEIHVLKIFFRDDFERLLCWLDHWLSCLLDCIHVYVFHSWKTDFKKWLNTLLSIEILKLFFIAFLIAPRYLVNRSRKLLPPWQLLDTWWIDRASIVGSDELFLDTCSTPQLSATISLIPTSIASSTPLDTCIYRDLLKVYIYFLRDPILISSICPQLFISQTLSLSLQTSSFVIFQAFSRFFFSW